MQLALLPSKEPMVKACGGLSNVCVHADRHMHTHGTAKETEQMPNSVLCTQPQKINKNVEKKITTHSPTLHALYLLLIVLSILPSLQILLLSAGFF
jgi:hypothetical protein